MISTESTLYVAISLLGAISTHAIADDAAAPPDSLTVGLGGQFSPRYSGSNKQVWHPVPVLQGRKGAFFVDSQKGIGYDLQNEDGLYLEHTLSYDPGRAEKNSGWRDGANNLKGMGNIDATLNTAFAVGWAATSWLVLETKAALPLTGSQGVKYQTSVMLIPLQNSQDVVAFQSAALFGDNRYMNTFYGVSQQQSRRSGYPRFSAPGGFYGIDSSLTWSHQFDEHWGTALSAGYSWLGDHAAASPIVLRRNEGSATMAVSWTF